MKGGTMSKRKGGRHVVPPRLGATLLWVARKFVVWLVSVTGAAVVGGIVSPIITASLGLGAN